MADSSGPRSVAVGVVIAALLLATPAGASAQDQPWEFGVDAGFEHRMTEFDDSRSRIVFPNGVLRMAHGIGSKLSIEGVGSIRWVTEGDANATEILLVPMATYHFRSFGAGDSRPYVSGGGAFYRIDGSVGDFNAGETQFGFSGRAGLKVPFANAGFLRFEAALTHLLEGDIISDWTTLGLYVGIGARL